jgi:hypothetical protein
MTRVPGKCITTLQCEVLQASARGVRAAEESRGSEHLHSKTYVPQDDDDDEVEADAKDVHDRGPNLLRHELPTHGAWIRGKDKGRSVRNNTKVRCACVLVGTPLF